MITIFAESIKFAGEKLRLLNDELDDLKEKVVAKKEEVERAEQTIEEIRKMQASYDRENYRLAVQRGVCPFPNDCNKRDFCTRNHCNADSCTNGYAFRWS